VTPAAWHFALGALTGALCVFYARLVVDAAEGR
jgi:hypothetical protein